MTDAEARMILHDLEHQGASSLSMDQIYAIRRAQGALDDISEAKRLLKLAIQDMRILYEFGNGGSCYGRMFEWRYADEALKLLKEE